MKAEKPFFRPEAYYGFTQEQKKKINESFWFTLPKGLRDFGVSLDYTVELQWLEDLRDNENYFETGVVRVNEG